MTQIFCLSHSKWQAIPTRTQHLLSRMQDAEVLFFEPASEPNEHTKPGRRVRPGLTVYALPPAPPVSRGLTFFSRRALRKQGTFILNVLARHEFNRPLLWATSPRNFYLLDYLIYRGLIYDCDRYWAGLPPRLESDLALAADVIFAASAGLADRLAPCCDNIALLPNGANYPMFCRTDLDLPPRIAELRGPILGFVGTIWADLDLSPVLACAKAHPDWNLVLLGRVERDAHIEALQACPNVLLLGQRPLLDVPDYIARFQVCLDLRRTGVSGDDVIPPRVYEYLSAGKPIVSMHFPGRVPEYPDVILAAHTAQEFVVQCEQALLRDEPWLPQQRRDHGACAAWSQRADKVIEILQANGLF